MTKEPYHSHEFRTVTVTCETCGKHYEIGVAPADHLVERVFAEGWGYEETSSGEQQYLCPEDATEHSRTPLAVRDD